MDEATIYSSIISTAGQLTVPEVLAVVFGLIYVILAARENVWCWFWGILNSGLWAYVTYYQFNLLADALLNIFYVAMGFIGLYQWKYGGRNEMITNKLPVRQESRLLITRLSLNHHLIIFVIGCFLTFLFGYCFATYTNAAATYLDSFTTIFAIVATILTVRKILENWLYWIVVDLLYIYLYITREGYLFALLFVLYCVIAIFGYLKWRKVFYEASPVLAEGKNHNVL